jgi:high-affinity iron transporter
MRYSKRLPIEKFFAYSALLIAVLAVVLIGKGVSALQEAGYLPIALMSGFPRIEILGVYPTREGVIAQILMAILLFIGFRANTVKAAK